MSENESSASTSSDNLVPKKKKEGMPFNKAQYFAKYTIKLF